MVMSVLLYEAETWTVTQQDIKETEDFANEMPLGHCGCDSVGYAAQCGHTGGDWRATNERAAETEEAPVVRTLAEGARPSATEATAAVQTERK